MLAVLVEDADAVYPVRIDPTFSDANWISMGGIPGVRDPVYEAVVDGSGNLYIGGYFHIVGDVFANFIAKWDGSSWTALGSGMDSPVFALAVTGSDLYAGGLFHDGGWEGVRIHCPCLPADSSHAFGASLSHRVGGFLAIS